MLVLKRYRWLSGAPILVCRVGVLHRLNPNRPLSQYARQQWSVENELPGPVHAITQTPDGYLWIGTARGLVRFDGFDFHPVPLETPAPTSNAPVLGLSMDDQGNLMVLPQGSGVLRVRNGHFEIIDVHPRAASQVTAMRKDEDGSVLLTDLVTGVIRFHSEKKEVLAPARLLPAIISMAVAPGGRIWLGSLNGGLFSLFQGEVTRVETGLSYKKINCLLAV